MTRYISAETMTTDDFGNHISKEPGTVVYDAQTIYGGAWATMTEKSWEVHGLGKLGLGWGQKYVRNDVGQLHNQCQPSTPAPSTKVMRGEGG